MHMFSFVGKVPPSPRAPTPANRKTVRDYIDYIVQRLMAGCVPPGTRFRGV